MWENIGGIKFWQIAVDKANGEEYFDESNDRSSEVSLYLQVVVKIFGKLCKSTKISLFNIFHVRMSAGIFIIYYQLSCTKQHILQ